MVNGAAAIGLLVDGNSLLELELNGEELKQLTCSVVAIFQNCLCEGDGLVVDEEQVDIRSGHYALQGVLRFRQSPIDPR